MTSYCCFWCPEKGRNERTLADKCPSCGRPYGTPLFQPPQQIRDFKIVEPISRGFYGAVYRATEPSLDQTVVLKVCPIGIYDLFGKNWAQECKVHAKLAKNTPFLAKIQSQFDEQVDFQGSILPCHVAVLEDVPGPTLAEFLDSKKSTKRPLSARTGAQIALDLYEILDIFWELQHFHNDLHDGNIIVRTLDPGARRSDAYDPLVRAVAIDLNSVTDDSQSGPERLGDHHHVSRHIAALASRIHDSNTDNRDEDFRIALALRGLAEHLAPAAEANRPMTVTDVRQMLTGQLQAIHQPWRAPYRLRKFSDAYNAQGLESWDVPDLWFDPDGKWLAKTTSRGPQVITGMRGCGKTMLLRSLHFHARAALAVEKEGDTQRAIARLRSDDFVGLFVSCQRLLDPQNKSRDAIRHPFERLYVAYMRDAVQVLRHLRDLDSQALVLGIDTALEEGLRVLNLEGERLPNSGELGFDQFLLDLQFRLAEGKTSCTLRVAPTEAFTHLARVLQGTSPLFAGKRILFLLDDASTRYLDDEMTGTLISQLLFQHPQCAFRITTEAQALQRVIYSPGQTSPADPTRDYEEFDLGNEVYSLLKEGSFGKRTEFITQVLRKRGEKLGDPIYQRDPKEVLGDVPLEKIASEIADSSDTSPARKQAYRGLRALQAVCVGDIGDIVKIYEKILERARNDTLPISAEDQSACFLDRSGWLMQVLNRRSHIHKDLALAFAQASGDLLHRSRVAQAEMPSSRLRQYTQLYVRIEPASDSTEIARQLFDLIDAGVFVLTGGVTRTKTRDDDPVLQFKLSYRKVLGLASFIGLADRDRFELSGDALRRWLTHPEEAKEILIKNQILGLEPREQDSESPDESVPSARAGASESQPQVSRRTQVIDRSRRKRTEQRTLELDAPSLDSPPELLAPKIGIRAVPQPLAVISQRPFDAVVIALGFEERARASAQLILSQVRTKKVVLVTYDEIQGREVIDFVSKRGTPYTRVTTTGALADSLAGAKDILVDVSGMSKPFLFAAVRTSLLLSRRVCIAHTRALEYYPSDAELEEKGIGVDIAVDPGVFDRVAGLLVGETEPYRLNQVYHAEAAPDRLRALVASASPKNGRLLHLLDNRAYDDTRILVPPPNSPRDRLARLAAELAASAADAKVGTIDIETDDLQGAIDALRSSYADLYFGGGANVELGLTGSKMHAVAAAALAATVRVADVWYVSPTKFDHGRFTRGVGETMAFDVEIDQAWESTS